MVISRVLLAMGEPRVMRVRRANATAFSSMRSAKLRRMLRRDVGASFFHAGKASTAAVTAFSRSSSPAMGPSPATKDSSTGLCRVNLKYH